MKIAVTGASGFLGRHLMAEAAERGHPTHSIPLKDHLRDPDPATLVDLLADTRNCDAMVNCAAAVKPKNPVDHFLNAEAPLIMASIMKEAGGHFVHISSLNVIIPELRDPYSLGKRTAEEKLIESDITIIRPGLIWSWDGEGNSALFKKYLKLPLPVHPMLFPGNTYFPLDVGLIAKAICDALEGEYRARRIVNLYGNLEMTIWDLAKAMADRAGRTLIPVPSALFRGLALGFGESLFGGNHNAQQFLNLRRRGVNMNANGEDMTLSFALPFDSVGANIND